MTRVHIIAARRSPVFRAFGTAAQLRAEDLAAPVLAAALADARLPRDAVEEVVLGNAAGPGGNIARLALLTAGWPVTVPGLTVDRQCGAGLEAVAIAADRIAAGRARVIVAGGVESASTAPWRLDPPRAPGQVPTLLARARFAPAALGDPDMGVAAETLARRCRVSRDRQDAFAAESHRRAAAHRDRGGFAGEIVPLAGTDRDEGIRADSDVAALARLPPAFETGGTVTAGNACKVNDGAAALVVVAEEIWRDLGRPPSLLWCDHAAAGVEPQILGFGPVPAIRRLLARDGGAFGRVEFTEAFAAQVLACLDALGVDPAIVNPGGGALALGHPWGASGAILIVRLFADLCRPVPGGPAPVDSALATMGIAGGIGLAARLRLPA